MHPATACIRPTARRRGLPRSTWAVLALTGTSIAALVAVLMLDTGQDVAPPLRTAQSGSSTVGR